MLELRPLLGLTLAAIPLLALGLVDDLRGAGPWTKLAVQACSAMVLVHFGYGVPLLTNPFGAPLDLGVLSGPLAVVWVLLVVNAINLIDGLDGLASGVVLIAAATLWWVGRTHSDLYVMFIASLLIGSTLGFLRWNFPPARVFMGDTGSHFLGLTLAAVALLENRKETAAVTLLFPLVALGVPVADSLLAFARRLGSGRHVFHADREHIHHRLLGLGPLATQRTARAVGTVRRLRRDGRGARRAAAQPGAARGAAAGAGPVRRLRDPHGHRPQGGRRAALNPDDRRPATAGVTSLPARPRGRGTPGTPPARLHHPVPAPVRRPAA